MSGVFRTLLIVAAGAMAFALAYQNRDETVLRFLWWESRTLPVSAFLLVALGVGVVIGAASLLVDYVRLRRQLGKERRRADEATRRAEAAEREAESLRSRSGEVEPALRESLEVVEEEDPDSTALSRPGRGSGGFE